jgi:hypothetical protein
VLPNYVPQSDEVTTEFRTFLSRDEFEPLSIGLHALGDVENLQAEVTDLIDGSGNVIPVVDPKTGKKNLDLRIVKVWPQAGRHRVMWDLTGDNKPIKKPPSTVPGEFCMDWTLPPYPQVTLQDICVPELLVYDDRQKLRDQNCPCDSYFEELYFQNPAVLGPTGRGLLVDERILLSFPTTGLDPNQSTISFWFRPEWDSKDDIQWNEWVKQKVEQKKWDYDPDYDLSPPRTLFNLEVGDTDRITLWFRGETVTFVFIGNGEWDKVPLKSCSLTRHEWYRVVFTWNTNTSSNSTMVKIAIFDDTDECLLLGDESFSHSLSTLPSSFNLGSRGEYAWANGTFDELRVYNYHAATEQELKAPSPKYLRLEVDYEIHSTTEAQAAAFEARKPCYPRIATKLETTLKRGTSKQLWLTIHARKGTQAGVYQGKVKLTAPGFLPKFLDLEVRVLAIDLVETGNVADWPFQHGIFLTRDLVRGMDRPHPSVPPEMFRSYLKDMRDHGLNSLHIRWSGYRYNNAYALDKMLEQAKDTGFRTVILWKGWKEDGELDQYDIAKVDGDIARAKDIATKHGYEADGSSPSKYRAYIFTVDEPNPDRDKSHIALRNHIALSHRIHKQGALSSTALLKQTQDHLHDSSELWSEFGLDSVYDLKEKDADKLTFSEQGVTDGAADLPIYHATYLQYDPSLSDPSSPFDYFVKTAKPLHDYCLGRFFGPGDPDFKPKPPFPECIYWQPWEQKPNQNRILAGFFLSASGLDGAFPVNYVPHRGEKSNDVFNDFDNPQGDYRDAMTVYPGLDGPIPTTQWEAYREGIDDLRYVETLRLHLKSLPSGSSKKTRIEGELSQLLATYLYPSDYNKLTNFNDDRCKIAKWINEVTGGLVP